MPRTRQLVTLSAVGSALGSVGNLTASRCVSGGIDVFFGVLQLRWRTIRALSNAIDQKYSRSAQTVRLKVYLCKNELFEEYGADIA